MFGKPRGVCQPNKTDDFASLSPLSLSPKSKVFLPALCLLPGEADADVEERWTNRARIRPNGNAAIVDVAENSSFFFLLFSLLLLG